MSTLGTLKLALKFGVFRPTFADCGIINKFDTNFIEDSHSTHLNLRPEGFKLMQQGAALSDKKSWKIFMKYQFSQRFCL